MQKPPTSYCKKFENLGLFSTKDVNDSTGTYHILKDLY